MSHQTLNDESIGCHSFILNSPRFLFENSEGLSFQEILHHHITLRARGQIMTLYYLFRRTRNFNSVLDE